MEGEEFFTSDVDLAAFLRTKGLRYVRVQPSAENPQIADFVFPESPDLFAALFDWMKDDVMHEFARRRRKMFQIAQRAVRDRE